MRAHYDKEVDVLRLTAGAPAETTASLLDDPGIAVNLATTNGHEVVGLILMGASGYIPLGQGYDRVTDTLLLGRKTDPNLMITKTGDFIGYWHNDPDDFDGVMDPVGMELRHASKHIAQAMAPLLDEQQSASKEVGG